MCGEGNGNPLQCSCLENPKDGGAWWAAVYGVAQSRTWLKRLSSSSSSSSSSGSVYMGFPGGASGKEPACQCRRHKMWLRSLGQEDPMQEGMTTYSRTLAMDRGTWPATAHWAVRSWTRLKRHSMQCIYVNPISQFLPLPYPWYPYMCSLCLCLYFCFVNKIAYSIFFSDSRYMH